MSRRFLVSQRTLVVLLALAAATGGGAQGQEPTERRPAPLSMTDLVRLLSGGTYTRAEVATIIERSCLSFVPSANDRQDLERLGADAPIFSAIDVCLSPPRAPAPAPARAPAPLLVSLSNPRLSARVGEAVMLSVQVRRATAPAQGVQLELRGTDAIPGGPASTLRATTDPRGEARFQIPAGTAARQHSLQLAAIGESLTGPASVTLQVAAGPAVRVQIEPDGLTLTDPPTDPLQVSAIAFDRFGNRVPRAMLTLRARSLQPNVEDASPPFPEMVRTTSDEGEVRFLFRSSLALARYAIEVLSDGVTLASIPVTAPALAVRPQEPAPGALPAAQAGDPEEGTPEAARPGEPGEEDPVEGEPGAGGGDEAVNRATEIDQRMELAEQALEHGEAETAVRLYEGVVSLAPDNAQAWFQLGLALAAAGESDEARTAYGRSAELDPERADQVAAQLALLPRLPLWLQLDVWGGAAIQTGETSGDVMVEASLWPLPYLGVWARYDRGLGLHNPFFVRRTQDLESYWGGVALGWGKDSRLLTSFEMGRRTHATDLFQYVYHGEQAIRIPGAGSEIAFGGYLGRWFDRDDWVGYARADLRVSAGFAVRPSIYVGETVTALGDPSTAVDAARFVENEVRGYLGFAFRPIGPLEIEPVFGIGSVDSPTENLSGSLLEGHFRLSADLGSSSRFEIFVRHQRPPGGDSFTTLAAGLALGVSRGGSQP